MGSKSSKYIVNHDNSIQNENKTLSLSSLNLDGSRKKEISLHQDLLTNMDNLTLIWLDTEINNQLSNIDTQVKLKNIFNYVQIFDQIDEFEQYIERIGQINNINKINKEKLLIIISTAFALTIIPHLHDFPQVKYIYIYGKSKIDDKISQKLLQKYLKVKGIFNTSQSLLSRITEDQN